MKFTFAILFTFVLFKVHSQSISPQTINVSGSNTTANGVTLDYSIGESSSISFYKLSDNSTLSTGVLQSYTPLITGIVDLSFTEGENISVYPNPASQNIRIKGILNHPGFIEYHIVDMGGRVINLNEKTYYINFFEKEFNISALNDGVYFIRLMYQSMDNSSKSAVFKFIKIQE
jgi:hypothetical protein